MNQALYTESGECIWQPLEGWHYWANRTYWTQGVWGGKHFTTEQVAKLAGLDLKELRKWENDRDFEFEREARADGEW